MISKRVGALTGTGLFIALAVGHLISAQRVMKSLKWPKQQPHLWDNFIRQTRCCVVFFPCFMEVVSLQDVRVSTAVDPTQEHFGFTWMFLQFYFLWCNEFHFSFSWFIFRTGSRLQTNSKKKKKHDPLASARNWHGAAVPTPPLSAALEATPVSHDGEALRFTPCWSSRYLSSSLSLKILSPVPSTSCCASYPSNLVACTAVWSSCWWWGCLSSCWWTPTTCLPPSRRMSSPTGASSTSTSVPPALAPAGAASSWTARCLLRPGVGYDF